MGITLNKWLVLFVVSLPVVLRAELPVRGHSEYRIGRTETLSIASTVNQQEYWLYIRLPRDYSSSKHAYPVVILQDTGFSFPIASGTVELMGGRDIEDVILVGISYAKDISPQISRTRDFTPTYAPNEKGAHSIEAQKYSGKALDYIAFMEQDVIPLVAGIYRVNENEKVFVGHSFGGLLGAYILLVKPELFDKYILGSPSLWYDKGAIFRLEEEFSKKNKSMNASVFMYIGEKESQSSRSNMVQDLLKFERILKSRNYRGLEVNAYVLDDATHYSTFTLLLPDALKKALPKLD